MRFILEGGWKMILDDIRASIKNNASLTEDNLIIRGLWSVDCLFKPNVSERTFNYKFLVAQTLGQGCAYSLEREYDVKYLESLMGKNYLDLHIKDTALEVAILDAIYSTLQSKPDRQVKIEGTSVNKTVDRTNIIVEETLRLVDKNNLKRKRPLIANIGVVGNFIKALLDADVDVIGADFDAGIVGKKLFDKAEIVHGDNTLEVIKISDVALITGMTLTTNTLGEIIDTAKEHNTKLVMFAETGSNLGDFFIKKGVNCVIGEPFPFYIFQGTSILNIFRKE